MKLDFENGATSYLFITWAADLEDDILHINGSGRNHILTAWYSHQFKQQKIWGLA